jgi:hypothetical protein
MALTPLLGSVPRPALACLVPRHGNLSSEVEDRSPWTGMCASLALQSRNVDDTIA